MRQIILDTETTGLEHKLGHRIIEIAAVELVNRRLTNNHFHRYCNPERDIDAGALEVHGITLEFLQDKPKFRDIVDEFLRFVEGAELVIHNAAFDVGFINAELALLRRPSIEQFCSGITDTLKLAKELHPGQKNNLDALCRRYFIDNSARTLHGALLDAALLGDVYLAMTRGQESLMIDLAEAPAASSTTDAGPQWERVPLAVLQASDDELAAHRQVLEEINKASKGGCLWKAMEKEEEAVVES